MIFFPGWESLKTVEKIHALFEWLETISLAIAIFLELSGMRRSSNVAWVALVISDAARQVYGRREKALSDKEAEVLRQSIESRDREVSELRGRNVALEQRMGPRVLQETEVKGLIDLLAPYHKTRVEIIAFDAHVAEPLTFSGQIASLFVSAGFMGVRLWEARAGTHRIAGLSVIIAVAIGHEDEFRQLAHAFARALKELGIDCGVGLGVFGCEGRNEQGITKPYVFGPPQYQLRFEKPRQFMGIRAVSAFRVEVGAKQLTAIPPTRPITPLQA